MGLQNFLMSKLIENSAIGKKIQSSDSVSKKGQFALDATEKNPNIENTLAEDIANLENTTKKLENSVKNIISLPNGATTGDAQIEDAKVGINGESYDTLGDSIREQIKSYRDVELSNKQPTGNAKVWVDTSKNDDGSQDIKIPQVEDNSSTSIENTWSANKISNEILKCSVYPLEMVSAVLNDGVNISRPILEIGAIDLNQGTDVDSDENCIRLRDKIVFDNLTNIFVYAGIDIEIAAIYYNDDDSYNSYNDYRTITGSFMNIKNDAAKVRFSFHKTDNSVFTNDDIAHIFIGTKSNIVEGIKPWRGKHASFLGDGITTNSWDNQDILDSSYPRNLKSKTGLHEVDLVGGIGLHMSSAYDGKEESDETKAFTKLLTKIDPAADIIVVSGGTNDYAHTNTAPFGTIADTTDVSFYGALNVICKYLTENFIGKRIVFMTPIPRNGGTTPNPTTKKTLKEYSDAIKEVCALYSIKVIDNYNEIGFNPSLLPFRNSYMEDGVHLNSAGHELFASRLAPIFNSIG